MNLLADKKAVDSTPKYSLLAGDTNQVSLSSCLRYANEFFYGAQSVHPLPFLLGGGGLNILPIFQKGVGCDRTSVFRG